MDLYLIFFGFGLAGLVLMAFMGFAGAHGATHGAGHGATHGSHGHLGGAAKIGSSHHVPGSSGHATHSASHHGSGNHGSSGNASAGHHSNHHSAHGAGQGVRNFVLGWLTPRVVFTLSLGGGAAGLALATIVPEPFRGLIALSGGVLLEKIVVSPLWTFLLGFASKPARNLESAVFEEAIAITNFDKDDCGIVSILLDDHEMRVLGRLAPSYSGQRVRQGDTLLVESVDATRGRCVVTPTPVVAPPATATPPPGIPA